jgi:hypothetical protein
MRTPGWAASTVFTPPDSLNPDFALHFATDAVIRAVQGGVLGAFPD